MNEPIENTEAAGRYLETLINFEQTPELMRARLSTSPIRALLDRLGKPDQGLAVIHVAGSKGKGGRKGGGRRRGGYWVVFTCFKQLSSD